MCVGLVVVMNVMQNPNPHGQCFQFEQYQDLCQILIEFLYCQPPTCNNVLLILDRVYVQNRNIVTDTGMIGIVSCHHLGAYAALSCAEKSVRDQQLKKEEELHIILPKHPSE